MDEQTKVLLYHFNNKSVSDPFFYLLLLLSFFDFLYILNIVNPRIREGASQVIEWLKSLTSDL